MNIAIGSIFRNSTKHIDRYIDQVYRLAHSEMMRPHNIHVIAVEGDSTDDTYAVLARDLRDAHVDYVLKQASHGGPDYGRVDDARRWSQIAMACNHVLESVRDDDDILVYVESDLIWSPKTVWDLIVSACLPTPEPAVLTCMVWNGADGSFWDTWAFRKNGVNFQHWPPYHPNMQIGTMALDSCGSILVMPGKIARQCRFQADDGIVGWCRDIRAHGYPIYLDPDLSIVHPSKWHAPREESQ